MQLQCVGAYAKGARLAENVAEKEAELEALLANRPAEQIVDVPVPTVQEQFVGTPIDRLRAGAFAQGVVTQITLEGVFVNFGAAADGLLRLPREVAQQFRVLDEVHGMVVEVADSARGVFELSLEGPALDESAPPQAAVQARPKRKAKGRWEGR